MERAVTFQPLMAARADLKHTLKQHTDPRVNWPMTSVGSALPMSSRKQPPTLRGSSHYDCSRVCVCVCVRGHRDTDRLSGCGV